MEELPELTDVDIVEDTGDGAEIYQINPDDARLPDIAPGQLQISGALGILSLGRYADAARCLALHPGNRLGLAGCGETIYVLDLSEGKRDFRFEKQRANVSCLAFSRDGKLVLSGDRDGGLLLWELRTARIIRRLDGHRDGVRAVAFSPNGRYAASGGDDGVTRLWELETGEEYELLEARWDRPVNCVAFSPDGKHVLAAGGKVCTWSVKTGEPRARFRGGGEIDSAAYSEDGSTIAACAPTDLSKTGLRVQHWEAATGKPIECFTGPFRNRAWVSLAAVVPGSLRIVSMGHKPGIRDSSTLGQIVDALGTRRGFLDGWEPASLPGRYADMADLCRRSRKFDPSDPYCLQTWNLRTGLAESYDAGEDRPTVLTVSSDGMRALFATRKNTVHLWGLRP